jgi:hypothetical protein
MSSNVEQRFGTQVRRVGSCDVYVINLLRYVMLHFVTFTVRRVIERFVATSLLSGPIRTIGLGAELLNINFMVLIPDGSIST